MPFVVGCACRPDHLTRASRELARWDHVVGAASRARVPDDRPVVVVDAGETGRTALMTDRAAAAKVTAAILKVVSVARGL